MQIEFDVADRVHWLCHARTNCYLVEDDTGLTLVDAGLPSMWPLFLDALRRLGRPAADVKALLLTHGHFDHLGFAARFRTVVGAPVFVHPQDAAIVAHPYSYRPQRNRFAYLVSHPGGWMPIARMAAGGALRVHGLDATTVLRPDLPLDVPGTPVAVPTPGHTDGHCAFILPGRDVVLCGDALVTFDPYTGQAGPQIVATAATSDSARALASLDALAATGAGTLLPGHGDPWRDGAADAVRIALDTGAH